MPSPPDWTRSTFSYDDTAGRYRDGRGRFVSGQRVRASLDRVLDGMSDDAANLSNQLREGQISLGRWQSEMMKTVKQTHLLSAASYKGGWAQLTQSDYGRVGQIVRREYDYLRNFADDIASGRQKLDGTVARRARLYAQQGRPTHYAFAQVDMKRRGFDQERSIVNQRAEHCDLCISEAGRGFVPIGELIPIGQRTCKSNDRCSMEYRNSATGETRAI